MKYYIIGPLPYIFFTLHWLGIIYTFVTSYFYTHTLYFYPIIIISWYINENKCVISQIEYSVFNRTFLGEGKKVTVPFRMRYLLYGNFLTSISFQILYKIDSN